MGDIVPKKDIYEKWEESKDLNDNLAIVQSLSRQGFSQKEIAEEFNMSERTLLSLKNKHPALLAALKKGRRHLVVNAENALKKRVDSGDTVAIIYSLKVYGGEFFMDDKEFLRNKREEVKQKTREVDLKEKQYTDLGVNYELIAASVAAHQQALQQAAPERTIEQLVPVDASKTSDFDKVDDDN